MNPIQYEALADSIKIDDIATNDNNRLMLRRIKRNDKSDRQNLWIQNQHDQDGEACEDYVPEGTNDMGWLGYFIGKSDYFKELFITVFTPSSGASVMEVLEPFIRGVNNNKSIRELSFDSVDLLGGKMFSMLSPFFENNPNLRGVAIDNCHLGDDGARLLTLTLGSCTTLTRLALMSNNLSDERMVDIITAFSMHPHLKEVCLNGNRLNKNSCMALTTLLKCSVTGLNVLDLGDVELDDEGIDVLIPVLKKHSSLHQLWLNSNPSITSKGWQILASILEAPNSNLEELYIGSNNVDDEALAIFATALANNHTLTYLVIDNYTSITEKGWESFSNLLCDTSSINATYLSNHTFLFMGILPNSNPLRPSLELNDRENKKEIAMIKIIQNHNDFDMLPFFEWEFKVLPHMIIGSREHIYY